MCIGPIVLHRSWRNWNVSLIGIVTRLRAGRSGIRIPAGAIDFSYSNRPHLLWDPSSLLLGGCRVSFLGVKRLGRDVDHSLPSSAEVKHEWSCTAGHLACLRVMDRDSFIYFYLLYCECLQSNGPNQYLWMEMWLDTLFCRRTPSHCVWQFQRVERVELYLKLCGGNS